jgi:hypothetical protein
MKISREFERLDFGHFIGNRFLVIVPLLNFVKLYRLPLWSVPIIIGAVFMGFWLAGYIADKTGFRDGFIKRRFGGMK